jgi:uncharacterized protein (DUF2147 family)
MISPRTHLTRGLSRLLIGLALAGTAFGTAMAAEPTGHWIVKDQNARIKIGPCGNVFWGVIDWATKPNDTDKNNPDAAKRNRSIIGLPILLGMKPSGANEWAGEVYNAENGKIYQSKITLLSQDRLKITGCVLGGLFCGGEEWTRAKPNQMMAVPGRAAPAAGNNQVCPGRS